VNVKTLWAKRFSPVRKRPMLQNGYTL